MVFGLFKKKDPICGMKEEKGTGFVDKETGHWFCNQSCKEKFDKRIKQQEKKGMGGCCH